MTELAVAAAAEATGQMEAVDHMPHLVMPPAEAAAADRAEYQDRQVPLQGLQE
jgi:hypothetical protein